nr:PREDICTED: gametocyte-specific factor 1-like isoform X2 [Lepisosteus oculatus]
MEQRTFLLGGDGTCRLNQRLWARCSGSAGLGPAPGVDGSDTADPDKLVQCPYDKNHWIRACRVPYHFNKCRKNHPELASKLKTCPFNAQHLLLPNELAHHIANCTDGRTVNLDDHHTEVPSKLKVPVSSWQPPESEENWEEELDEQQETFIWGASASGSKEVKSDSSTCIPPGLRAPRTLPWRK